MATNYHALVYVDRVLQNSNNYARENNIATSDCDNGIYDGDCLALSGSTCVPEPCFSDDPPCTELPELPPAEVMSAEEEDCQDPVETLCTGTPPSCGSYAYQKTQCNDVWGCTYVQETQLTREGCGGIPKACSNIKDPVACGKQGCDWNSASSAVKIAVRLCWIFWIVNFVTVMLGV